MIWAPILCTGFSDVIGSWKIIAMSLPRTSRRRDARRLQQILAAEERRAPRSSRSVLGFSPMIVRQVTLLPEPDSPTMPSVLPSLDRERDAVDRLHDAVVRLEVGPEVVDLEESASSVEADARIDEGVGNVDHDVEDDDAERREDDDALDHRQVEVSRAWTASRPRPGQAEDRLGEDGAAERDADVHPEHRHDRQERVAEHVVRITCGSGAPLARAVRT